MPATASPAPQDCTTGSAAIRGYQGAHGALLKHDQGFWRPVIHVELWQERATCVCASARAVHGRRIPLRMSGCLARAFPGRSERSPAPHRTESVLSDHGPPLTGLACRLCVKPGGRLASRPPWSWWCSRLHAAAQPMPKVSAGNSRACLLTRSCCPRHAPLHPPMLTADAPEIWNI